MDGQSIVERGGTSRGHCRCTGIWITAVLTLGLLGGCVRSTPMASDPVGGGGNGGGGEPTLSNSVSVRDPFFSPSLISVAPGEVVVWQWAATGEHNITWVDGDLGLPNSPTQADGGHEVRMPSTPGNYGYYCTIHGTPSAGMRGTVIVE